MDNIKNIDRTEKYSEKVKELFKELASDRMYETWADTFEIESADQKQVTVGYCGVQDIKTFKKECKDILVSCIDSVMGQGLKIKIIKKSKMTSLSPKVKKNIKAVKFFTVGMAFVCIAMAVCLILCSYIGNRNFRETFYSVSSIKVDSPLRVIHISDLHGVSYGKNNKKT